MIFAVNRATDDYNESARRETQDALVALATERLGATAAFADDCWPS